MSLALDRAAEADSTAGGLFQGMGALLGTMMSLLDRLENTFTQTPPERRHPPLTAWIHRSRPDRALVVAQSYSLRLYALCALAPVATMSLVLYAFLAALLVWVAVKIGLAFPVLWHEGPRQAHAWRVVWRVLKSASGGRGFREFSLLPFVPLIWALFNLLIWLPRVYFWNRRARRLRGRGGVDAVGEGVGGMVAADVSVWPPPPHMS